MLCHFFPRAGRRRKNAILSTTFHYFPRAVSGRQSERDARREVRRARRAGQAAPSRSKYLQCLTYSVCLVCRHSAAANHVRGAASATANQGVASAGALFPAASRRRLTQISSRTVSNLRAGAGAKNAILSTTFHYFPRAVSGRQSERDARKARRAGQAAPSRSKYLHCLTYGVCLVC